MIFALVAAICFVPVMGQECVDYAPKSYCQEWKNNCNLLPWTKYVCRDSCGACSEELKCYDEFYPDCTNDYCNDNFSAHGFCRMHCGHCDPCDPSPCLSTYDGKETTCTANNKDGTHECGCSDDRFFDGDKNAGGCKDPCDDACNDGYYTDCKTFEDGGHECWCNTLDAGWLMQDRYDFDGDRKSGGCRWIAG